MYFERPYLRSVASLSAAETGLVRQLPSSGDAVSRSGVEESVVDGSAGDEVVGPSSEPQPARVTEMASAVTVIRVVYKTLSDHFFDRVPTCTVVAASRCTSRRRPR